MTAVDELSFPTTAPHRFAAATRRVLFLDHTAMMGGGEVALLNLVRHLDRSRYHPVVVLFAQGPLAVKLAEVGIETHVLPLSSRVTKTKKDTLGLRTFLRLGDMAATLLFIRRLASFMREQHIHLVHTNSLKADVIGGLAARLADIPLIWHIRDRIEDDYLPAPVVHVFRWLCRVLPDSLIANSAATLQTLHLARHDRGEAIHSGVELDRTRVVHDGMGNIQPAISDLPSAPGRRVGLVGRISPWKGQHVFVQAAALVLHRFPDVQFQIIGAALFQEQDYEREVRQLARDLQLGGRVEFTGFRDDVPQLISELEVLVHASTTGEPFGQVVIEGMSAGKPVVATAGGGVPEIVIDGITGLLVPMGDAEAMAAAICRLLEDPTTAQRMGQLGRQRVLQQFTIGQTASKIEALYDEILESRTGASQTVAVEDRSGGPPAAGSTVVRSARVLGTAWAALAPACITLASVGMALALTLGLRRVLKKHVPISAPFLAAVAISVGFCGRRAGLASVALSALVLAYFVFPPHHSFQIDKMHLPAFITFVIVGLLITWVTGMLHEANTRVEAGKAQVEEARRGLDFVSKVAASLSIVSTREGLFRAIGYLAVTNLCDWCAIDLVGPHDETMRVWEGHRNVKLGGVDPPRNGRMMDLGSDDAIARVLESGSPVLLFNSAYNRSFGYRDITPTQVGLSNSGRRSVMVVPMAASGRIVGTITLASVDSNRAYKSEDLKLATEFAWRSALALERFGSAPHHP